MKLGEREQSPCLEQRIFRDQPEMKLQSVKRNRGGTGSR